MPKDIPQLLQDNILKRAEALKRKKEKTLSCLSEKNRVKFLDYHQKIWLSPNSEPITERAGKIHNNFETTGRINDKDLKGIMETIKTIDQIEQESIFYHDYKKGETYTVKLKYIGYAEANLNLQHILLFRNIENQEFYLCWVLQDFANCKLNALSWYRVTFKVASAADNLKFFYMDVSETSYEEL
jgi:hypothetical protein